MMQTDLNDLSAGYPANHFAYRRILPLLQQDDARSVLEIGVGHGGAVDVLSSIGLELSGIDIDAGCGQRFQFFPQRMQACRHHDIRPAALLREEFTRVRRKGQHRCVQSTRPRLSPKLTQQRLMSQMHAIEIANRDDRIRIGGRMKTAKYAHEIKRG